MDELTLMTVDRPPARLLTARAERIVTIADRKHMAQTRRFVGKHSEQVLEARSAFAGPRKMGLMRQISEIEDHVCILRSAARSLIAAFQ
ncbi:hypothetical protein [Tsuneonella deserti]|uniref:hypothetical protein n=1 Tax=Tsuneonella deserti TaxID=2035528 RepID=UPI001E3EC2F4|nr:hypothetical protein [Tsuneonella deserti]